MNQVISIQDGQRKQLRGWAYCPICTHVVETEVVPNGRKLAVKAGQKCPRCASALEPATVIRRDTVA